MGKNRVGPIPIAWLAPLLILAPAPPDARGASAGECPTFVESSTGLPTKIEWRTHPAFGDVNGDGHLDLAGHPRKGPGPGVWLGDGAGSWSESKEGLAFPSFSCGVGVELADVNGDGHLDLGVADHCKGLFVYYGDGKGRWRLGPLVDPIERHGREDLAFGDIDRDGMVDLVAVGTGRGGLQLYRGNGAEGWTREQRGLPTEGQGRSVSLADINGDGQLDVMATGQFPPTSPILWLSRSDGSYQAAPNGLPDGSSLQNVRAIDINGDGILDLVATGQIKEGRPPILVFLRGSDGGWTQSAEGLPGVESRDTFHGVVAADMNGDDTVDLVAVNWGKAGVRLWTGDGMGRWRECADTGLPAPAAEFTGQFGYGIATGDVNHDGKPDLAAGFGLAPRGSLRVWLQR